MIITGSGKLKDENLSDLYDIASRYNLDYKERRKGSIKSMIERYNDDILVFGDSLSIHLKETEEILTYHPNIAMVRAKRVINKQEDAFLTTCQLDPGMSILDCTAGLGADSLIASMAVGESGHVTALEANFKIYLLLREGLKSYEVQNDVINHAMRRINIVNSDHTAYLKRLESNSFDVVYFDPMFNEELKNSPGIQPLSKIAQYGLSDEAIMEAKRVARKRIVLKDDYKSQRFSYFGFRQIIRKTSKFHFGVIDVDL